MKDFKYNNIPGLESVDTQQQLDTFEALELWGSKDRFIFDFSTSFVTDSDNKRYWKNEAHWNKTWDTKLGVPGDAAVYYKNYDWGTADLTKPYSTQQTILGQDFPGAPYYEENGGMFVGAKYAGIFGQGSTPTNPDAISTIRSGYYEFTIKTDKNNCIIGYGGHNLSLTYPIAVDTKSIFLPDGSGDFIELKILIENGKLKLEYNNPNGNNKMSFSVIGNKTISNNEWHHIVVNLGKPGVRKSHSKKHNERFIEFWVDGELDKRTTENINNQVFFPTITWLLIDPTLTLPHDDIPWLNIDYSNRDEYGSGNGSTVPDVLGIGTSSAIVIGNNELDYFNGIDSGYFNNRGTNIAFRGSIHTYVAGYNQCLDMFEIKLRNNLWRGIDKGSVDQFKANAKLMDPIVTGNKKRALKLFWNNLVNTVSKNGIELDNSYEVDTISVTHKTANSNSEIYNIDKSNSRKINYLKDVRVAVKDNLFILRPGAVWIENFADISQNVGVLYQNNMYTANGLNALSFPNYGFNLDDRSPQTEAWLTQASVENISISGVNLNSGDRILLTNQYNPSENGIYIFNSLDTPLSRSEDANSSSKLNNAVVRVIDGYYKDTSWILLDSISTLNEKQNWKELEFHPTSETIESNPLFVSRWNSENGNSRLIDLQQDIDISKYDLIVFMNYPENNEDIKNHMINFDDFEINNNYQNFIKSLQNVCAQGASLYVSSPKLAQDLGIIKNYELIDQMLEMSDAQSATISPFEVNEPADQYFDTHRINQYQLQTEVAGLTNKPTYILTDFINYVPSNINEPQQYHAKYAYRQLGLKEGNQFFIPSLSLLKIAENDKLPGFSANRKGTKELAVVEPNQVNTGTIVTKLQNTYYQNGQVTVNPHDDDATTIIVHNGQILNGQPINGKIFVNFIEDGYTMSRAEYNKAFIQVVPAGDINETTATRAWQYSTSRLNRLPQRINIRELTEYGQTTSTNGGGGPFIQAQTNSSNGIIRSESDRGNVDYQSDLYTTEAEEIYPIQEIPVLSMTYLGLQWLAE